VRGAGAVLAAALAARCAAPPPAETRVLSTAPEGSGVAPELAQASVTFSGPVAPEGIVDGTRLVLVPAEALPEALRAVEADEGAAGLAAAVGADVALEGGGVRAVLRPRGPLRARTGYALVLSSRALAEDGGPVLDAERRRRPTVGGFETGAAAGPPPLPVLTEVRAAAAAPGQGGEWVEIADLGEGPLDLAGWRLVKRTASGFTASCLLAAGPILPPGTAALVVGGAYDGRYDLPPGTPTFACGGGALLGGLSDDHPPALHLLDPLGEVASTFGAAGMPRCPAAAVRLEPLGPDDPSNLDCADGEGTPGELP